MDSRAALAFKKHSYRKQDTWLLTNLALKKVGDYVHIKYKSLLWFDLRMYFDYLTVYTFIINNYQQKALRNC